MVKLSDKLRGYTDTEEKEVKLSEKLRANAVSANAAPVKLSEKLRAIKTPAAPIVEDDAAKYGIIADDEDTQAERLTAGVKKNLAPEKWGSFGEYAHKNPGTVAKYAGQEVLGGAADTIEGVGKAIKTVTDREDNMTADEKAEAGILADSEDLQVPANVQKAVDERIAAGDAKVAEWKRNLDESRMKLREATGAPQIVSDIFSMAGQLALMGVTGAVGGGGAVRGLVGASTFGTSYEDAAQMGAGEGQALLYAALNAIGQSKLEGLGGIGSRQGAETALQSILSEALEEGGAYTLETALQNEVLEADVPWSAKEAVYSAFLGALGGGAFAAGNVIGGKLVTPQMQQQAQQMAQRAGEAAAGAWLDEAPKMQTGNTAATFAEKCLLAERGELVGKGNLFVFAADNTPDVIQQYGGASNVPIIIRDDILELAVAPKGEKVRGTYHNLGAGKMVDIINKLDVPEYIIRRPDGRLNVVVSIDGLNGKSGLVSLELNAIKNLKKEGVPGIKAYNLIPTVFDAAPRYVQSLLNSADNQVLYDKEDPSAQVRDQRTKMLDAFNAEGSSSTTTIANGTSAVNKKDASSQVGGGLYAYPSTIDEKASLSTPNIADGGAAVNPQTAPSQYATNTMQQAAAAGALGQETADTFADAQHRVVGWSETTTEAQAEIDKRGATGAAQDLINKANGGQAFTSTDVQKGQILMQQLSKSAVQTDRDLAIELGEAVIRAASDIGRALNIMRSMIRELPGGLLRVTQRQVEKAGGKLTEQDIADINALEQIIRQQPEIQQMEGSALIARLGVLTADMSADYRRAVGRVFDAKNGDPANADSWLMMLAQKKVAEHTGSSVFDQFTAAQRINLLLNPKTQVRNLAGNLLSTAMEAASDPFAAVADKLLAKKTGKRTVGSGKLGAAVEGAKAGARDVQMARELGVLGQFGNRYTEGGKARPQQVFSDNELGGAIANWLNDYTTYLLTLGDAVFSGAREAQVGAQLESLGADAAYADSLAEAAGREATFQNDSDLSRRVIRGRNAILGDGIIGRIILPFAKTPANILSRAISYSPAGLIEGAYAASKVLNGSDLSPEMQRKAATAIGRGMIGSMLTLAGAGLAAIGRASGAAPEDKDEAAFLKDVGGVLPNSFKIGDTWVDLSNLGPGMVALNLGATVYHELQRAGVEDKLTLQVLEALMNGIVMDATGDSLWQGVLDAAAYLEEGDVAGLATGLIGDAISQSIPLQSLLRAITGSVDKYKRETSAKGGNIGWSVNYIKSNIPGVSQNMPIKYDVAGNPVERYEGGKASDIFNAWLNPAAGMSKDKTDSELYQQVMGLYEQTGDKSIFPTVAPYSIEYQGEKYALRGKERSEYQQTSGKDIVAQLDDLFTSAAYKQASPSQQTDMIADLISYSTAEAKTGFLAGKDVAYEKSGISSTIDKLAAKNVPASAVVLLAATDTGNEEGVKNSGAVKAAKAAAKLNLSADAEYALIEHYGSKTIAECVKTARAQKVDVAAYLDTYQMFANEDDPAKIVQAVRGAKVGGDAMLTMLTDATEERYGRFDGRWTVNGRSYAALNPETYTALVLCLDGDLTKAENVKRLTAAGISETAANDFYTVYKSNSSKYD